MNKRLKRVLARRLQKNDRKEVEELIRLYIEEEPMTKYFNLTEEDKEVFVEYYSNQGLGLYGAGLGYFDADTGKMIGCGIVSLPGNNIVPNKPVSENMEKIVRYDRHLESFSEDIIGERRCIYMDVAIITPGYRGLNIFDLYMKWLLELAKEEKCDVLVTTTSSVYAHNRTVKGGFIPIKTIIFKDYRDPLTGDTVLADMPPPHTQGTLFIKWVNNHSKL